MRYSTFLRRRHNSRWTHSPQTQLQNKMAECFGAIFRDFVGAQKFGRIQKFFTEKNFKQQVDLFASHIAINS